MTSYRKEHRYRGSSIHKDSFCYIIKKICWHQAKCDTCSSDNSLIWLMRGIIRMSGVSATHCRLASLSRLHFSYERRDPDMNPNHLLAQLLAPTTVKQWLILWFCHWVNKVCAFLCSAYYYYNYYFIYSFLRLCSSWDKPLIQWVRLFGAALSQEWADFFPKCNLFKIWDTPKTKQSKQNKQKNTMPIVN